MSPGSGCLAIPSHRSRWPLDPLELPDLLGPGRGDPEDGLQRVHDADGSLDGDQEHRGQVPVDAEFVKVEVHGADDSVEVVGAALVQVIQRPRE